MKRRSCNLVVLGLLASMDATKAFWIGTYPSSARLVLTSLFAKRKTKPKSKPSKKRSAASKKGAAVTTQPQAQKKKSQQKSSKPAPPWQVMSTTEAKKNIQVEKERRNRAQQGIHSPLTDHTSKTLSTAFLDEWDTKLLSWRRFRPDTIARLEFVSAHLDRRLPERLGVPEVAFLGRSNVGKSSLLNQLCRTNSARVGKTPGATASVNLYQLVNGKDQIVLGCVDLPGFGYAKLSRERQEHVMRAAEHYLNKRKELALGILLVDIRRDPSDDDRAVLAALFDQGVPIVVVATKLDKVPTKDREKYLLAIQEGLGLPNGQPFSVSSVTGEGCRSLWSIVLDACETHVSGFKNRYLEEGERQEAPVFDVDDDDNIEYNQGYEWIHQQEHEAFLDEEYDPLEWADDSNNDDDEDEYYDDHDDLATRVERKESFQDLKKRVRDLEERGEL